MGPASKPGGKPYLECSETPPLGPALSCAVLSYLGHRHLGRRHREPPPGRATLAVLDGLIRAYTRRVPWESAFRIAKRARTEQVTDCPRWPLEFWLDALERGGGGTCFESNYAFFSLLRGLGYEGYLTINDMGDSVACHSAIVLVIEGQQWLADVGLPLYCALPLDPRGPRRRTCSFHTYTVIPDGGLIYQIVRDRHPKANCYTLIDRPVPDADYRRAIAEDYGPGGHFLDRVIVNKVIADVPWRFNGAEEPLRMQSFPQGQPQDHPLSPDDYVTQLARHFGMNKDALDAAFQALAD